MTDWIRVGLNDEEYVKESPLYFHTFQDIFHMLINGLVIGIDRKTYGVSFCRLMRDLVFIGEDIPSKSNVYWKAFMFNDPYSKEAQEATLQDFKEWLAAKFDGFELTFNQAGAIDPFCCENFFRRYARFNTPEKVLKLAYEMLAHVRWTVNDMYSSTWSTTSLGTPRQGNLFMGLNDPNLTRRNDSCSSRSSDIE